MQQINGTILLTTTEMMTRTGKSRSTLIRWANAGIPGAYYNNYSHSWEWDVSEYLAGIRGQGKPNFRAHSKPGAKVNFQLVK